MDAFHRRLADAIDQRMMAAITGTANVTAAPSEPLTLDKLRRVMLAMPPKETWLSSRLFPADKAITVEGPGERFTCAHPGFWARAEDALRKSDQVSVRSVANNPLGFGLTPIEIDACEGDRPETAEWRAAHWTRLREAFEVAMTPLPDWLRAAPKFGKHG